MFYCDLLCYLGHKEESLYAMNVAYIINVLLMALLQDQ